MTEKEIWVPCPGFEKWYDISNMGNVRSYHIGQGKIDRTEVQRVMSTWIGTYLHVPLSRGIGVVKLVKTHILVARAFIANPYKRKVVHHKNNNKLDPRASNLEWVTSGKNQEYAYRDGYRKRPFGELNGRCKLTSSQVLEIFNSKENIYKLADHYQIDKSVIADIRSGKLWSKLTGKKYISKNMVILTEAQILEIVKSNLYQDLLAEKYQVSQSRISSIKTGRSHSEITGIKFKGKSEYSYHGIKTTHGKLKIA